MNPLTKVLLGVIGGAVIALPSVAIPYKGNNIYRSTFQGNNYLILSGTPGIRKDFYVPRTSITDKYKGTDDCKWISVNLPPVTVTNFLVNGVLKNPYTVNQLGSSYNCSYGSSNYDSKTEWYNPNTRTYYYKGSAPRQAIKIEWIQPSLKRARFNECGFYMINLKETNLSGKIQIDGQEFTLNDLAIAPYPPLCRFVDGVKVPYVAAP